MEMKWNMHHFIYMMYMKERSKQFHLYTNTRSNTLLPLGNLIHTIIHIRNSTQYAVEMTQESGACSGVNTFNRFFVTDLFHHMFCSCVVAFPVSAVWDFKYRSLYLSPCKMHLAFSWADFTTLKWFEWDYVIIVSILHHQKHKVIYAFIHLHILHCGIFILIHTSFRFYFS